MCEKEKEKKKQIFVMPILLRYIPALLYPLEVEIDFHFPNLI